ncbi:RICIN domain-containing protein [Enterococcus sp. AZ126]|uniref:RICIN domain-containing protein n=1 Tax=Enterococcus sp. AZ126 TaxID=2774635 RepID=UPI003F29998C
MSREKKFKIIFIFFNIFLFFIGSKNALADQIVPNNLYVAYPQNASNQYLDISQSLGNDRNYLITYAGHGLGNQLMGYEYRPEKKGYIIYSAQDQNQLIGQSADSGRSEYIKSTKFSEQVNSLTDIPDEFIWDINLVDSSEDSYTIANRKSSLYMTAVSTSNDSLIKLSPYANNSNQFFKLRTKNGIYIIRSRSQNNMVFDIANGVAVNNNVIAYNYHGGDNQRWLVTYNPRSNAYMIANSSRRNLLFNQPYNSTSIPNGSPNVINNNLPFERGIPWGTGFQFTTAGAPLNNKEVVNVQSQLGNYVIKKDNVNSGVSTLSAVARDSALTSQWVFDLISPLPEPTVSNLIIDGSVSGESNNFFVGEKLTISGDVSAVGFYKFDVYYKLNLNSSTLVSQDTSLNSASAGKFKYQIDTLSYSEGINSMEYFVRADKAFLSNKIPKRLNFKYPTPTGDAVPQNIDKNTPISSLDLSKFVVNLHDELGNPVTIDSINKIDTSVSGIQQSEVTLRNKYKTSVVKVPVNIIDKSAPTGTGKITVVNQNDTSILQGSDLSVFIDDLVDKNDVTISMKEGQDINQLVSTVGPTYFDLVLTNTKNGLYNEVRVPLYVKNENTKAAFDKNNLLLGNDISVTSVEDYPKNDLEMSEFIQENSKNQLWQKNQIGELTGIDSSELVLNTSLLPKPGTSLTDGDYAFTYTYGTLSLNLNLNIKIDILRIITVLFVDEANKNIREPIKLEYHTSPNPSKPPVADLSMSPEINDQLSDLENDNYLIVERPENEKHVSLDTDSTMIYQLAGTLSIKSYPQKINFGQQHLILPFIDDDKFSYDAPLIIWDNRKTKDNQRKNWQLTATLTKPLTSEVDPTSIIYDALYYQINDKNIKLPLIQDQAQTIKENKNDINQPEFNLSKEWENKNEGLQLQLFSKQVNQEGNYTASILWKIGDLP